VRANHPGVGLTRDHSATGMFSVQATTDHYLRIPFLQALEAMPSTLAGAVRPGLVTRAQVLNARAREVLSGPAGIRILETASIRSESQR
jgi:hypothetical protein